MKTIQKKAFTLVELIVVITILSILWTIGFISLQNYTTYARDSVRISDLNTIRAALHYTSIATGEYSYPDNPDNITFSWTTVWKQWTFWTESRRITQKISKIPTDPLTKNEYTFSVTESKQEFELWAILESGDSVSNKTTFSNTYAAWEGSLAYVIWNYNWKLIKTQADGKDYVLAVPSIINSEVWDAELLDILTRKKLVYNWYSNIPSIYWIENTTPPEELNFVDEDNFIVFEWTFWDLANSEIDRLELISNLQTAYSWSVIENNSWLSDIIWIELDVTNPTVANKLLAKVMVENFVNIKVNEDNISNTEVITPSVPIDPELLKFISVWDTDKNGSYYHEWVSYSTTPDEKIKLPLDPTWTYNFTVDWWDWDTDIITSYNQAETEHTYSRDWEYTITIEGVIEGFTFNAHPSDNSKIINVLQWWNMKLADGWKQFQFTTNLDDIDATDSLDVSNITNMNNMFSSSSLRSGNLWSWNTSNVTDMNNMFKNAYQFNEDISNWDTSNVEYMNYTFFNASSFNQDISGWNTGKVKNMSYMFYTADDFNQDLLYDNDTSSWNTSGVEDMSFMFAQTESFNWNISNWDTSSVENMKAMFYNAESFNGNIWWWNTAKVEDMWYMFSSADIFSQDIWGWDTSSVTNMSWMLWGTVSFNQNISGWDTDNVTNCSSMYNWYGSNVLSVGNRPTFANCTQ